ncbi:GGDEF domain-containing response regulator [Halieaceae bacterium IMCC14734]|uniref:GGDEF domain-containing response regulator n=1 Tax=Candidatus Litorirhabdus singularis TaxID=2518993 RepID=A0ABT3TLT1_9GAMM|nr:GGDEF domain-containing response regulator [Candidatus Litorirhabdus singularis]MCX2983258.1 GGDEF domain-containing response regulator [Candidatus Litorirhabdus singularis]
MGLKNILIISEDKTDQLVLSSSLQRAVPSRFNVTIATSLERPLDALMDRNNDAVILAHAPETDYLLRLAQKNDVTVPIIVLLAEASAATVSRVKGLGARDFLLRSNIQDDLLHRILDYSIELGNAKQKIQSLSNRDALTGVLNRTGFRAHVERAIARSERYQTNTALIYINIDQFTNINDQYGEGAGDQAIKMIARRLSNKKRNTDSVARLGGDEFAVVLEDVSAETNVDMVSEKMMMSITEPMRLNEQQVSIEVSVGASVCPDNGVRFEDLVEAARNAMTQAKAVPGNKYFRFNDQLTFNSGGSTSLSAELRQAVRNDQFELYYQPRINLKTEKVVGLEALLRWNHPERGMIRPDEFLPLCENMGLMKTVGHRVIEKACSAINWLDTQGLADVDVAVNVSFSQFQDERFTDIVKDIVGESGIDPRRLEFELTESVVLKSPDEVTHRMEELRRMGHSFSLDDFGTGFSQLSHMTDLPISALKIDKSFVKDIPTNRHQEAVCMMIIDMAQRLDLLVIAEGAEEQEQVDFLKGVNCHQVQGFYYSPAIPLTQIPRFAEEQLFKESLFSHTVD